MYEKVHTTYTNLLGDRVIVGWIIINDKDMSNMSIFDLLCIVQDLLEEGVECEYASIGTEIDGADDSHSIEEASNVTVKELYTKTDVIPLSIHFSEIGDMDMDLS